MLSVCRLPWRAMICFFVSSRFGFHALLLHGTPRHTGELSGHCRKCCAQKPFCWATPSGVFVAWLCCQTQVCSVCFRIISKAPRHFLTVTDISASICPRPCACWALLSNWLFSLSIQPSPAAALSRPSCFLPDSRWTLTSGMSQCLGALGFHKGRDHNRAAFAQGCVGACRRVAQVWGKAEYLLGSRRTRSSLASLGVREPWTQHV